MEHCMCGDSIRKVGGEGRGRMGEREEGGGTREREEERGRGRRNGGERKEE